MTNEMFLTTLGVITILLILDFLFWKFQKKFDLFRLVQDRVKRIKLHLVSVWNTVKSLPALVSAGSKPALTKPVLSESSENPQPDQPVSINYDVEYSADKSKPIETGFQPTEINFTELGSGSATSEKVAKIQINAEIPIGTSIHITISAQTDGVKLTKSGNIASTQPKKKFNNPLSGFPTQFKQFIAQIGQFLNKPVQLNTLFFFLTLGVFLFTRFYKIEQFPIYFFSDEAVQTDSARGLIENGWKGPDGQLFPTYFQNGTYFNLSTSVYTQIIPSLLFPNSVPITRGTSALITLLSAIAVGLILRDGFKIKRWWLGSLLLSITPAWFLHSRTAFETALFVSFYAMFFYFYILYLNKKPTYIFAAIIFAAVSFYSYSPGQLVIAVTILFLFFSDRKIHWQNRNLFVKASILIFLLLIPYLRFRLSNPYSPFDHLRQLGSYWLLPIPITEKVGLYLKEYFYGLSPQYWFLAGSSNFLTSFFPQLGSLKIFENSNDLTRHLMKDYGQISWWTLPLFFLGVFYCVKNIKNNNHRALLLVLLAAPAGAALAEIGITRVLVFIIPACILSGIGLDAVSDWIENLLSNIKTPRFPNFTQTALSFVLFSILALFNFSMMNDALKNGPLWYDIYALYGLQYGAKQILQDVVVEGLKENPARSYIVSPSWANGTEMLVDFFIPKPLQAHVKLGQPVNFVLELEKGLENTYFITTVEEYNNLVQNPIFKDLQIQQVVPYPDGKPGFYVITIKVVDNIEAIIAAQHLKNRTPVEDTLEYQDQTLRIMHSPFNNGSLKDIFDNDSFTLARVLEANPFVFDIYPDKPISTSSISIQTGAQPKFSVKIILFPTNTSEPVIYSQTFSGLPPDPTITLQFDKGPSTSSRIYIEIKDDLSGEYSEIHVRTINIK